MQGFTSNDRFRTDINGLRAWAVLAVVLYHFQVAPFDGGFVGVDVFFVISGFLMAGIVERGVRNGNFSLLRFYVARAARIWPALIVVCAVLLGIAWFLLVDSEYSQLGKHVRDSLLFISNLRYAGEDGYFDTASHGKWLLHTWSLSVEWQFYLVFPVLYGLLYRLLGARSLPWALGGLALASLAVAEWMAGSGREVDAFFTLQARAWEMLAGSLIFLVAQRSRLIPSLAYLCHFAGFLLIIVAVLVIDHASHWPGLPSLLPVLGAALIILAGVDSPLVSGRVWQWLGDKSYSIYLWHWPVMVLLHYFTKAGEVWWVASGILLSLLLGGLSHRLIEQPARGLARNLRPGRALIALLVLVGVVIGPAQYIRKHSFAERLPENAQRYAREADNHDPRRSECLGGERPCHYGGPDVRLVVIGDSHANAVVNAIVDSLPDHSGLLFHAHSGCLVAYGATRPSKRSERCTRLLEWVAEELPMLYPGVPVVVVNRTSIHAFGGLGGEDGEPNKPTTYFSRPYDRPEPNYLEEFRHHYLDTLCSLARSRPTYVVQPIPEMHFNVPEALSRDAILGRKRDLYLPLADYQARHAVVRGWQVEAAERCGVQLLDPVPHLCAAGRCEAVRDDRAIYYDDDHMSEFGNRLLIPMFEKIVIGSPR